MDTTRRGRAVHNGRRRVEKGSMRWAYNVNMSSQSTRDRILESLQDLPPDATFEDAIERLVFLAKIDAGLAELDAGEGIPHDEVKRQLGL